jgi:hypothetical protein
MAIDTRHDLQVALEAVNQRQDVLGAPQFRIHSYSGRGMFGDTCLAVTIDRNGINEFELMGRLVEAAAQHGADKADNEHEFANESVNEAMEPVVEALRGTRTDSMGLGIVIYWPNISYVETEEKGYDPDEFEGDD